MLKRLFFSATLLLNFLTGGAQVSMSLQEPPAGIVRRDQLWNVSLIYSGSASIDVSIGLTLVDMSDNQTVLSAYSSPITLTKGVKQLKATDVSPVQYIFLSPSLSRITDAFLPIGAYRACYTLTIGDAVNQEDCISIEVQPLSPPQLTMPADSAQIQNYYPQFSWLPPVPPVLFSDLNYDLLVAEVGPDQTPLSAIQENVPVYFARRLTTPGNIYPSSDTRLDTSRVYAWRVIAKNGEAFAAQSEVWTFRVKPETPKASVPYGGLYMELKKENTGSTGIISDNILGIRYYSYDSTHETVVKFFDQAGALITEAKRKIEYGNNFMVFTLDRSFRRETTYFIEIADLQMSRFRVSFRMAE
jgi:hypothetical protein